MAPFQAHCLGRRRDVHKVHHFQCYRSTDVGWSPVVPPEKGPGSRQFLQALTARGLSRAIVGFRPVKPDLPRRIPAEAQRTSQASIVKHPRSYTDESSFCGVANNAALARPPARGGHRPTHNGDPLPAVAWPASAGAHRGHHRHRRGANLPPGYQRRSAHPSGRPRPYAPGNPPVRACRFYLHRSLLITRPAGVTKMMRIRRTTTHTLSRGLRVDPANGEGGFTVLTGQKTHHESQTIHQPNPIPTSHPQGCTPATSPRPPVAMVEAMVEEDRLGHGTRGFGRRRGAGGLGTAV